MSLSKNGSMLRRRVVLPMLPVGLVAACSPGADGKSNSNGTASARRARGRLADAAGLVNGTDDHHT